MNPNYRNSIFFFIVACILFLMTSYKVDRKMNVIEIETDYGVIDIKLYDKTPLHKKNIESLIEKNFYDSLLFHRVIQGFMIQGGDPDSKTADSTALLGSGGPGYTIQAEIEPEYIHKKGAVAAARLGDQQNPGKESSGSQFYIVQGKKYTDEELTMIENQRIQKMTHQLIVTYINQPENKDIKEKVVLYQKENEHTQLQTVIKHIKSQLQSEIENLQQYTYTKEQREVYKEIGGAPFLDFEYTVFGEVIDGLDVVDSIANVKTQNSRPERDIRMIIRKK
ncbi:MAG: peptidylprolyl isomerase [Bacteroidales bacterium]